MYKANLSVFSECQNANSWFFFLPGFGIDLHLPGVVRQEEVPERRVERDDAEAAEAKKPLLAR